MRKTILPDNGKRPVNYEKRQVDELKELNLWFIINTLATAITGIAAIVLAIISLLK